jgi:uncharacterized protein YbjQ (UPF0145 family)
VKKPGGSIQEFQQAISYAPDWVNYMFGGETLTDMMFYNVLQVLTIGLAGWLLAAWFERRHLRSLSAREAPLQHISINTCKNPPPCEPATSTLLIGSVVVAHDYFRTLIITLKRLIGGSIEPYERLIQRGRREALIRLKEEADLRGLDKLVNVRFGTTSISGRFLHAIEMVAYGTGVRTRR